MRIKFLWIFLNLIVIQEAFGSLKIDTISKIINPTSDIVLTSNWVFHPGDDKQWANPDIDDSSWQQVDPLQDVKTFTPLRKSGIGWLRIHLPKVNLADNRLLSINITQYVASEIYLNGKKILQFGVVSSDAAKVVAFLPSNRPLDISLLPNVENVIALRIAYQAKIPYLSNFYSPLPVFKLTINDRQEAFNTYIASQQKLTWFIIFYTFSGSILLIISFIHFVNFLFDQRQKIDLYYSLMCMMLSFNALPNELWGIERFGKVSTEMWIYAANGAVIVPGLLFLLLLVYTIVGYSRRAIFTVITIIGVIFIGSEYYLGTVGYILASSVFPVLCLAEGIYVCFWAIRRRKRDAYFLLIGISLFVLFNIVSSLFDQDSILAQVLFELSLISFPIGMSFFLAIRSANKNRKLGFTLEKVKNLSFRTIAQEKEKQQILNDQNMLLESEVAERTRELNQSLQRSDSLLLNILPADVAEELKNKGSANARQFDNVTVIFTDFVNFTSVSETLTPQQLVDELDFCFKAFDNIIDKHQIEKIKTIGDAYLAVAGLPNANTKHANNAVNASIEIMRFVQHRKQEFGDKTFDIRIGLHSGSVVAGIVGIKKFAYDIWGDTVNTAARMEQNSEPGKINVSEKTYELIQDNYLFTYRGEIPAKNKGNLKMYFVY
ncbi:adenylate/guanylate cyclase domain-containing protein [Mucilaginibacter ginkgonis]|uniref:Guanylate cyclase domain-containing protein n=1 Tax=Mucilaginibacter ginkgonis TaxID=2682091 RepID=A0A6I4IMX6_9SPHI|nr:adenylate/guanylate cyclase domain-containing protein [Mucilaginibacter ginkgonis]QQL49928.1 hypothetical protein GO620_000305 [Mucilaginibacter ginkgonis]